MEQEKGRRNLRNLEVARSQTGAQVIIEPVLGVMGRRRIGAGPAICGT